MVTRRQDQADGQASSDAEDAEYDAFVRAKVQRGLEQSRDRSAMIQIEQVWRDFSVER